MLHRGALSFTRDNKHERCVISIFSGINNVSITGSRPENIKEGEYVLTIASAKAFVTRKDKDAVVFEFSVEDAEQTGDAKPNRVGSKVRAFFPLARDRSNALTEDGERWMGRLKTLIANILGGEDRVDADGEPSPVTDDEVDGLIAASIVKGTEYKVANITDETKRKALMFEVATKSSKDGGLDLSEDDATAFIEEGRLNFADVRGLRLRCAAKVSVSSTTGKAFTNLYWSPVND
jgi:hypothetical protein